MNISNISGIETKNIQIIPRYTTDDEDMANYKARAWLPRFYTYERYLIENLP